LNLIQSYFGVGSIKRQKTNGAVTYFVSGLADLTNVIIPHFQKYPLITQKRADFALFQRIIDLMNKKEHLNREGLNKIASLKASMNKGLSEELKIAFSDISTVERPLVTHTENVEPDWIAGFTDAEGCFDVSIYKTKTKTGFAVQLRYRLTQHSRDLLLFESLKKNFGCGNFRVESKNPAVRFDVTTFKEISDIIIPFFYKYPLQGSKRLDYEDFCKVAELMKNKAHLTQEGLDHICKIKAGMNTGREHIQ
jgi:hypothetical protein